MPTTVAEPGRTTKGEQTRALILRTALDLFRERGYEETTMRLIAQEAGVAPGNIYYYFRSKEHLIQGFYALTLDEHVAAARPVLARETDLRARLLGVMRAKVETSEPYHRFSGILFKSAADPSSPLSPFSPGVHTRSGRRARPCLPKCSPAPRPAFPTTCKPSCPTYCGSTTWASSCSGCTTAHRSARAPTVSSSIQSS